MATKKTSKNPRYILVNYEHISGEYELLAHTVLKVKDNDPDDTVNEYFIDFYGGNAGDHEEDSAYYYYNGGEIGVKVNGIKDISEDEYKTLKSLGLAH